MRIVEWKHSPEPVPYPEAMAFMTARTASIRAGETAECIWFLEHPPLYTVGAQRRALQEDCPGALPYPLYESPRGGRITYHGPGQLVIYVMMDLEMRGRDLRGFMRHLLEWLQAACLSVGVATEVRMDPLGLWIGYQKIASAGVRVQKWVTSHGIALNINPDLRAFDPIRPCGLDADRYQITSLARLGCSATRSGIETALKETQNSLAKESVVL